jgi:hypothetical protein
MKHPFGPCCSRIDNPASTIVKSGTFLNVFRVIAMLLAKFNTHLPSQSAPREQKPVSAPTLPPKPRTNHSKTNVEILNL